MPPPQHSCLSLDRRRLLQGLAAIVATASLVPLMAMDRRQATAWPEWRAFTRQHIQPDGRVIDFNTPDLRSTSEGQAYALFFALADNDRALFERVLDWTRNNLCQGRLDRQLPAWWWGRDAKSGQWRVLDDNAASDADLWLAYTLLEAGALWRRPALAEEGRQLLRLIQQLEVAELPGLGVMLLPGPQGYVSAGRWRLNPSYLPIQLLRRFAVEDSDGPWSKLAAHAAALLTQSAPKGFAPDWCVWDGTRFRPDPETDGVGSYDAIRVYLWAGMLSTSEPSRAQLLKALGGPWHMLQEAGHFAERIRCDDGRCDGTPPTGFHAALLPYLKALDDRALLKTQRAAVAAAWPDVLKKRAYYDGVLSLFGQGWLDGRFRFAANGRLLLPWH